MALVQAKVIESSERTRAEGHKPIRGAPAPGAIDLPSLAKGITLEALAVGR